MGRNHPEKGFKHLRRALGLHNRRDDGFTVTVVGHGADELSEVAEETGVSKQYFPLPVVAAGPEDGSGTLPSCGLVDLHTAADYFALPSYIAGYPTATVEANAAGIVAIVTDAPGCCNKVEHLRDGIVVAVESPDSIADSMKELERDPELRARLVDGGLRKAHSLDWAKVARRHVDVYERFVRDGASGG